MGVLKGFHPNYHRNSITSARGVHAPANSIRNRHHRSHKSSRIAALGITLGAIFALAYAAWYIEATWNLQHDASTEWTLEPRVLSGQQAKDKQARGGRGARRGRDSRNIAAGKKGAWDAGLIFSPPIGEAEREHDDTEKSAVRERIFDGKALESGIFIDDERPPDPTDDNWGRSAGALRSKRADERTVAVRPLPKAGAETRNDLVHISPLNDSPVDGRLSRPAEVPGQRRAAGKISGMGERLVADERPVGEEGLEHAGRRKHKGEESEIHSGTPPEHAENDRATGGNMSKWNFVPEWARPSTEELKVIIKAQFGEWRTLSDTARRSAGKEPHQYHIQEANTSEPKAQPKKRREPVETYCKPMQQGMASYPEKHLRRCYDKLRERFVFGEPLRQVGVITMGKNRPVKDSPRGIVTFMCTSRPEDIRHLVDALKHLTRSFLQKHRYPVAIIHEDFDERTMETLRALVPVPVHFLLVEFKLPDWMEPLSWIYPLAVKHFTGHPDSKPLPRYHSEMRGLLPYVKRNSFGYFHMCRFFGGAGYVLPFFDDFDFCMRLDNDSVCKKVLPDVFQKLEDVDADYAYDSTFLDYGEKVQGLWNFAEEYIATNGISPTFWNSTGGGRNQFSALGKARSRPPYPMCNTQPEEQLPVIRFQETYIHAVPCKDRHFQAVPAFYTNFEVVRLKMIRSAWYQHWFNAVDKAGAILYNRWGDAPIRFLGLSMHLPAERIVRINGCSHT